MDIERRLEAAERRISALDNDNEALRDRIRSLESLLGLRITVPIEFGLTGKESALLGFLMTREIAAKEAILDAIYGHLPGGDMPEPKIIDVFVCKARKKLEPFLGKDAIETVWGRGYRLNAETKKKVRAMLDAATPTETPPTQEHPHAA